MLNKTMLFLLVLSGAANAQIECTETESAWEPGTIEQKHVAAAAILAQANANLDVTYTATKTLTARCTDVSVLGPTTFERIDPPPVGGSSGGWFGVYVWGNRVALSDHSISSTNDPVWRWESGWVNDGFLAQPVANLHGFIHNGLPCSGGNRAATDNLDRCHNGGSTPLEPDNKWNADYRIVWNDSQGYLLRGPVGDPFITARANGNVYTSADLGLTENGAGDTGEKGFWKIRGGAAVGQFGGSSHEDIFVRDDISIPPWPNSAGIPKMFDGETLAEVSTSLPGAGSNVVYSRLIGVDFNKDGCGDIVDPSNGRVWQGSCDWTFTEVLSWTISDRMPACGVGDFDGDGKIDLACTPNKTEGAPQVWRNTSGE